MCLSYQQFKGRAVSPLSLVKPFWKLRYHGDSESSQFDYKKKIIYLPVIYLATKTLL